mmetsp:Transcript_47067/g.125906  ORF Transcript_47067/g.125906 Transcript_47067/m.125906 type:complete len:511 (-) Transcript_47067:137-1669(-)
MEVPAIPMEEGTAQLYAELEACGMAIGNVSLCKFDHFLDGFGRLSGQCSDRNNYTRWPIVFVECCTHLDVDNTVLTVAHFANTNHTLHAVPPPRHELGEAPDVSDLHGGQLLQILGRAQRYDMLLDTHRLQREVAGEPRPKLARELHRSQGLLVVAESSRPRRLGRRRVTVAHRQDQAPPRQLHHQLLAAERERGVALLGDPATSCREAHPEELILDQAQSLDGSSRRGLHEPSGRPQRVAPCGNCEGRDCRLQRGRVREQVQHRFHKVTGRHQRKHIHRANATRPEPAGQHLCRCRALLGLQRPQHFRGPSQQSLGRGGQRSAASDGLRTLRCCARLTFVFVLPHLEALHEQRSLHRLDFCHVRRWLNDSPAALIRGPGPCQTVDIFSHDIRIHERQGIPLAAPAALLLPALRVFFTVLPVLPHQVVHLLHRLADLRPLGTHKSLPQSPRQRKQGLQGLVAPQVLHAQRALCTTLRSLKLPLLGACTMILLFVPAAILATIRVVVFVLL